MSAQKKSARAVLELVKRREKGKARAKHLAKVRVGMVKP